MYGFPKQQYKFHSIYFKYGFGHDRRNNLRLRIRSKLMTKPLIQIDDEVREMTDEEYALYESEQAEIVPLVNE